MHVHVSTQHTSLTSSHHNTYASMHIHVHMHVHGIQVNQNSNKHKGMKQSKARQNRVNKCIQM